MRAPFLLPGDSHSTPLQLRKSPATLRRRVGIGLRWTQNRTRDCGGELVTVGSDAHTPADVGKGVRAACALLRECGFRRVCTYEKHQPVFHTLG